MKVPENLLIYNSKKVLLIHDFVLKENYCNLSCSYCISRKSSFRTSVTKADDYLHPELKQTIDQVMDNFYAKFDTPILKVSGGEISLIKNIEHLLKRECSRYETIQIITNGLSIENLVSSLVNIPNVHIQFSLDGHVPDMNYYCAPNDKIHNKIIENLKKLSHASISVEIYCSLNNRNIERITDFADYLITHFNGLITLTPFPLRFNIAERFQPDTSQITGLNRLLKNYDTFSSILPPRLYLELLYSFLSQRSKSNIPCFNPYFMLQTFEDSSVTPCPYFWFEQLPNLIEQPDETLQHFGTTPFYHLRTMSPPRLPFCKSCFADTVQYSLFFTGRITEQELIRNKPYLQSEKTKLRLKMLKEIFIVSEQLTLKASNFRTPVK